MTGFEHCRYSRTSSTSNCPSLSGSPAWTISAAFSTRPLTIRNCFLHESLMTSFHGAGMIGKSSRRHTLKRSSYSSGSAWRRM